MGMTVVHIVLFTALVCFVSGAHVQLRSLPEDGGVRSGGGFGGGGGFGTGSGEDGGGGGGGGGGFGSRSLSGGDVGPNFRDGGGNGEVKHGDKDGENCDEKDQRALLSSVLGTELSRTLLRSPDVIEVPPVSYSWLSSAKSQPEKYYYSYYYGKGAHDGETEIVEQLINRPSVQDYNQIATFFPWLYTSFTPSAQRKVNRLNPTLKSLHLSPRALNEHPLARLKREVYGLKEAQEETSEETAQNEQMETEESAGDEFETSGGEEDVGEDQAAVDDAGDDLEETRSEELMNDEESADNAEEDSELASEGEESAAVAVSTEDVAATQMSEDEVIEGESSNTSEEVSEDASKGEEVSEHEIGESEDGVITDEQQEVSTEEDPQEEAVDQAARIQEEVQAEEHEIENEGDDYIAPAILETLMPSEIDGDDLYDGDNT